MRDATVFSIDVAVAKARNTVYYAGPNLQAPDKLAAIRRRSFDNRDFPLLALPNFP